MKISTAESDAAGRALRAGQRRLAVAGEGAGEAAWGSASAESRAVLGGAAGGEKLGAEWRLWPWEREEGASARGTGIVLAAADGAGGASAPTDAS